MSRISNIRTSQRYTTPDNGAVASDNVNATSDNVEATSQNDTFNLDTTFVHETTGAVTNTFPTRSTSVEFTSQTVKNGHCECNTDSTDVGYPGSGMAAMFLSGFVSGVLLVCLIVYFMWKRRYPKERSLREATGANETLFPGKNLYSDVRTNASTESKRLTISSRSRQETPEVTRRSLSNDNIPNLYRYNRNTGIYEDIDIYNRSSVHVRIKSLYSSPPDCIKSVIEDEYTLDCYSEPMDFDRDQVEAKDEANTTNRESDYYFILEPKKDEDNGNVGSVQQDASASCEYATVMKRSKVRVSDACNSETVEDESCDKSVKIRRKPSFYFLLPNRGHSTDHVTSDRAGQRGSADGMSCDVNHVTEMHSFGNIYNIRPESIVYL